MNIQIPHSTLLEWNVNFGEDSWCGMWSTWFSLNAILTEVDLKFFSAFI